jgi:hypothetical protein
MTRSISWSTGLNHPTVVFPHIRNDESLIFIHRLSLNSFEQFTVASLRSISRASVSQPRSRELLKSLLGGAIAELTC